MKNNMISAKQYIAAFYSLFDVEGGYKGFMGSKKILRKKLELKLNRYVPEGYFNRTLNIFREFGIVEKKSISTSSYPTQIKEDVFKGAASFFPLVDLERNVLEEKLRILEQEEVFSDVTERIFPLITKEELQGIQDLQLQKEQIWKEVLGRDYKDFFIQKYNKEYGNWIQDVNREEFKKYYNTLLSYGPDYFKLEKNKQEYLSKVERTKQNIKSKIYILIITILQKEFTEHGTINLIINPENDELFTVNMKVTSLFCNPWTNTISFKGEQFDGELNTWCKVSVENERISFSSIAVIEFVISEKFRNDIDILRSYINDYNSEYQRGINYPDNLSISTIELYS